MNAAKKEKLYQKFVGKLDSLREGSDMAEMFSSIQGGQTKVMKMARLESSAFDSSWISTIEDVIFDLGDIVGHPREVTKTTEDLVPVELAKKINSVSVQHLASHTQFIKTVDENGDVIPNKIISIGNEENIVTYENRFIATLIRRLLLFVQKRYEFALHFAPLHEEESLYYKTKATIDGSEVEIETKIKIKTDATDAAAETSNAYIDRIKEIRDYILFFYGSPFMRKLKTERDVRSPIIMTNILRKNPKYHHCYEVYRFIERYGKLGVDYKVREAYADFSQKDYDELTYAILSNYLIAHSPTGVEKKVDEKSYRPKVLTAMDDESFIYGPLLQGPILPVRADEEYLQYLASKGRIDLPTHPTKHEKEFYAEEYQKNREIKSDIAAIQALMKRKKKEKAQWDKKVEDVLKERDEFEDKVASAIVEIERRENELYLDSIREGLVTGAVEDREKAEQMIRKAERNLRKKKAAEKQQDDEIPAQIEEIYPQNEEVSPELPPQEEKPLEERTVKQPVPTRKKTKAKKPKKKPVKKADKEEPIEETPSEEEKPE